MVRRLTKREKRIFLVTLAMAAAFLGYHFVVKPLERQIARTDTDIEAQQKKLAKNLKTIKQAKQMEGKYTEYLTTFKQTKTNEQVMSSMLVEIEQVAGELNLQISDLKPQRVQAQQYFNRFSVSLTIESPLVDIIHFLYKLQNDPHLFNVEQVRFDKGTRRMSDIRKINLVLSKTLIP